MTHGDRPVALLCAALDLEYRAIRDTFALPFHTEHHDGVRYETADLGPWRVVLAFTGRDNTAAALHVQKAVKLHRPQIALLIGIAGGRRGVRHGDVVAADAVYDYEAGRDADGEFRSRAKSLPAAPALVAAAHAVAQDRSWYRGLSPTPGREPDAYIAPIAAGAKVVTGDASVTARLIASRCEDARAVETEGHGFMHAAHVSDRVDAMVVRGVSDLLGDKSPDRDRRWQPRAAEHAAAFAYDLIGRMRPRRAPEPQLPGGAMQSNDGVVNNGPGTVNVGAAGKASGTVIGMVGHNEGDVRVGGGGADPARLDELGRAVRHLLGLLKAHAAEIEGTDDEEEYEEAVATLEAVERNGDVERGRIKGALRSVGAFAGAVTAVGQAVAAVLDTLKSR